MGDVNFSVKKSYSFLLFREFIYYIYSGFRIFESMKLTGIKIIAKLFGGKL